MPAVGITSKMSRDTTDQVEAVGGEDGIRLESVVKHFGDTPAVDEVTLSIREGEFFSLLGPSGCGKTTLLRIVAGFETPDRGRVVVHGKDVTRLSPQKRPTAMVFQNYALFPTMTVGGNVEYGLRVRRWSKVDRRRRVRETLERVGLLELEERPVALLSGGQQQRVAVARALAVEPEVLLFDEPLSNLDVGLRERTRAELRELQHRLGITTIYVTHDQEEALALSDRIAVMQSGKLREIGTPRQLYDSPKSAFVAQFLGGANLIRGDDEIRKLTGESPPAGRCLAVRPEEIRPAPSGGGLEVEIKAEQYLGPFVELTAHTPSLQIRIRTAPDTPRGALGRVVANRWTWVEDSSAR